MKIAILGSGNMGREHAQAYAWLSQTEDIEIAGVVGRDSAEVRMLGKEVGAPHFTDPARVLEDDAIDAIDIAYPSPLHRQFALAALESGKHVFCETPMALTLEDADTMIAAAKGNERLLMVAQVMRFVSSYKALRDRVTAGDVGAVRLVVARRLFGPHWERERERPFSVYGEPVVELMIHDFNFLSWLLGTPTRVTATGVIGDTGAAEHIFALLDFGDTRTLVEGSWMMPPGFPFTTQVCVRGEEGLMDLTQRFAGDEGLETSFLRYPAEGPPESIQVENQWPHAEECRYFVRCVQGKADPGKLSPENEREALRVTLATRDSLTQGETISLD